jgi:phosphohistidine phosphatase
MNVYLVQHGNALSKDEDPDRPLSERGVADVTKVAAFVRPIGLSVSTIWHSGKTRARQTAERLAEAVTADEGTAERGGLKPKDDVGPVAKEIEQAGVDRMIVGHMPFLARLAGQLVCGNAAAAPVAFAQGGVVALERTDDGWSVAWMIVPELLTD